MSECEDGRGHGVPEAAARGAHGPQALEGQGLRLWGGKEAFWPGNIEFTIPLLKVADLHHFNADPDQLFTLKRFWIGILTLMRLRIGIVLLLHIRVTSGLQTLHGSILSLLASFMSITPFLAPFLASTAPEFLRWCAYGLSFSFKWGSESSFLK